MARILMSFLEEISELLNGGQGKTYVVHSSLCSDCGSQSFVLAYRPCKQRAEEVN